LACRLARSAAGQIDLAKKKYQAVIDQYPSTAEVATAKQKLAGM